MKDLLKKATGYQSRYPNIEVEVAGGQENYQANGSRVDGLAIGTTTLKLLSDWIYHLITGLFTLVNSFFEVLISFLKQTKLLPYFRFSIVIMLAYLFFHQQKDSTPITSTAYSVGASMEDSFTPKGAAIVATTTKTKKQDPFATAYIKRFSKVAQAEMNKFGIPASIKLAQGLLESNNGKSRLAAENFNHFGLKCFSKSCRKGHCSNHSDDTHKDFFRKYQSAWESWRDHSQVLMGARYVHLKEYEKDYKKWAKGLQKAGYATDKKYDKKLIELIEQYDLQKFDI